MSVPPQSAPRRRPLLGRLLLSVGAAVLSVLLLEGAASVWLALAAVDSGTNALKEENHSAYDADLGWSHVPRTHSVDLYGPGRSLTVNAQGLRAAEEYAVGVPPGRTRVLCVGDSFTMGFGVDDAHSYPAQLEALCPQIQAVNMGMGGYGLDQAYLWYVRDGDALDVDVVVFAFIDADFIRMTRDEFQGYPKPRLRVVDGALRVENVPVPRVESPSLSTRWRRLLHATALARTQRPAYSGKARPGAVPAPDLAQEAEDAATMPDLSRHVLEAIRDLARQRGHELLLLYLPTARPLQLGTRSRILNLVTDWSEARKVPLVDGQALLTHLGPQKIRSLYRDDNHFDIEGNALIAHLLLGRLAALGRTDCAAETHPWLVTTEGG